MRATIIVASSTCGADVQLVSLSRPSPSVAVGLGVRARGWPRSGLKFPRAPDRTCPLWCRAGRNLREPAGLAVRCAIMRPARRDGWWAFGSWLIHGTSSIFIPENAARFNRPGVSFRIEVEMLKKISGIKNVGTFRNSPALGDVDLRKLTLMHADNGRG